MKREFYLYKYRKDYTTIFNIHQKIERFICVENKSMAIINQEISCKFFYIITTTPIPEKFFFVKGSSENRPIYIDKPLIATIKGDDDTMFPYNENMDSLRNRENIINLHGSLDIKRYSIIINMYLDELGIPYKSLRY
jgi:hypothetical protein